KRPDTIKYSPNSDIFKNVFMVKTVLKDVGIWTIFNGVWPFLAATLIGLSLILIFPGVALMLPNLMLNLRN
ncbi:MAG: hypothetical protein QGH63_10310, partial [Rhodospirillales bacterium]|nr:hypothetical protein [Rhodospirillales bacterium]